MKEVDVKRLLLQLTGWMLRDRQKTKYHDTETRVYSIRGERRQLEELEKALFYAQLLGEMGGSRCIILYIDGDGSTRLKVERACGDLVRNSQDDLLPTRSPIRIRHEGDAIFDLG